MRHSEFAVGCFGGAAVEQSLKLEVTGCREGTGAAGALPAQQQLFRPAAQTVLKESLKNRMNCLSGYSVTFSNHAYVLMLG